MSDTYKTTILYVDDDSDDCIFLKTSIEDTGNNTKVICANDGEEAVQYLNSVSDDSLPSLIVLDMNMPRWDGKRTLQYIKSTPHLAEIPVVMLSTSEREKDYCKQMGAASYHIKPHHFMGYREIVDNFFRVMSE